MMQSTGDRIRELKRIIQDAEEEIHRLEWASMTDYRSGWGKPKEKVCTMPQGHPSHCGCEWR